MAYLNPRVLDLGLNVLDTEATALYICSAEPTSYAQATTTYALGSKSGISIGAPTDRTPSGRKVAVAAIESGAAGAVTVTGTATHYAIVDVPNTRLLAVGPITTPMAVTDGNPFTTPEITIGIPGPA